MSSDQNFNNLILDYPREAIGFFAAVEARAIDAGARLLPLREEQGRFKLEIAVRATAGAVGEAGFGA